MRKLLGALLLLLVLFSSAGSEAAGLNGFPSILLGLTPDEVVQYLGSPDYIKVFDYGPAAQYAYFTVAEWEMLSGLAPQAQGEDVYILEVEGKRYQYHITYTPVYLRGRFAPEYRVKEYTVYPESTTTIEELVKVVPKDARLVTTKGILRDYGGSYPPALVLQGARSDTLAKYFRRFRETDEVGIQVEIGLDTRMSESATLSKGLGARYLTIRAAGEHAVSGAAVSLENVFQ